MTGDAEDASQAITPPTTQYQLMEFSIDVSKRTAGTPVSLPVGWIPLTAERRAQRVVALLMRQIV